MRQRLRFPASIQRDILLAFLLLGLALMAGAYAVLGLFVLPTFENLEREQNLEYIARVDGAIESNLEAVWMYNFEYASWDDTYDFMLKPELRAGYIENNMYVAYWSRISTEFMLLFDTSGQLVWGQVVNPQDLTPDSRLQEQLLSQLRPGHPVLSPEVSTEGIRGIIDTPAGLALIVSNPILRSDDSGPSAGTLISGHFITPERTAALGEQIVADVEIYRLADPHRPDDLRTATEKLLDMKVPALTETTDKYMVSRKVIDDMTGNPIAVIAISAPRKMSAIGTDVIHTALLVLSFSIVLFIFFTWLFLRASIGGPVSALKNHIVRIRESGDLQAVFGYGRLDEIGTLAAEFNSLTSALGKTQRQLEKARDDAEASSRAKGEFLATMSHEIRTPLNGVIGMTGVLLRSGLPEKQRHIAQTVKSSGDLLLKTINDILDFSKMSAGKMQIETRIFSVRELVDELNSAMAESACEKGIEFRSRVGSRVPDLIVADDYRLRQVLINLIGNALKFTQEGEILFSLDISEGGSDEFESGEMLEFRIADTGIGIQEQAQSKIFEYFTQANSSTTREFGGTGLGLAICKQLVEKMGGSIGVESTYSEGSEFCITLPVQVADVPAREAELEPLPSPGEAASGKRPYLAGMDVLVAEDNCVNQEVIIALLEELNARVEIASNGEEVLAGLEESSFDLVIMDCHMPVMDGYEAARQIRQRGFAATGGTHLPILAMTANAMMGDRQKCLDAGMDEYLSKPFRYDDLLRVLGKILPDCAKSTGANSKPVLEWPVVSGVLEREALAEIQSLQSGSVNLLDRIIQAYLETSPQLVENIARGVSERDEGEVETYAHSLRSSSARLGAKKLACLCADLESMGRQGTLHGSGTVLEKLKLEFNAVCCALSQELKNA